MELALALAEPSRGNAAMKRDVARAKSRRMRSYLPRFEQAIEFAALAEHRRLGRVEVLRLLARERASAEGGIAAASFAIAGKPRTIVYGVSPDAARLALAFEVMQWLCLKHGLC